MKTTNLSMAVRIGRSIYAILAFIFASIVVIQVFLAGLAIFDHPIHWSNHKQFIKSSFGSLIPIMMIIMSFVGKMPKWALWQSVGLFVLIYVMYITANIGPVTTWLAAAHPVFALILFAVAIANVAYTWNLLRKRIS